MPNHDQPPMVVSPYPPAVPSMPSSLGMDYGSQLYQGKDLREYLHILLKRKWWVIGTFLTIFLATGLYTFLRTPIFRTATTLQITQDNPGTQVTADDKMPKFFETESLEKFQLTQYKILHSWSLGQRVVRSLNLLEHPIFKSIREKNPNKSKDELEDAAVTRLLTGLTVTPIKNTYLVEVSFESPDKLLAQKVVNAVADEYMYLSIDRRNESFALVRRWLDSQLKDMAAKVQEAQKKLYKFGQKTDIYTTEDKDNVVVQKFIDLSGLLTKAQADKMAKEAQYKQVTERGPNAPLIVNNPLVAGLRQQVVAQQAKVSSMQKVFRGGHPELQAEKANLAELQSRLQGEVQRLQESIKADFEAASRTENLLNESFSAQKGQMVKLQENLTDYQILKRDAQTNEQLYQALLARVKEANIAGTMVPANVAVIDSALLPTRPFKPKTVRDLALATVLGLALGIGLAFTIEYLDDSIKSLDDLERACNLPALGLLPQLGGSKRIIFPRLGKSNASAVQRYLPRLPRHSREKAGPGNTDLIVVRDPKSPISEAIRHIYSSLMLSTSGKPPCAIMVTSPNPGEGKTTLVSNLAISCAQNERRVLLIDCDLRRPRLNKIFHLEPLPGLSTYLTGNAGLEEILQPTSFPNLTVITAGAQPPSPSNLLNSAVFKELLTELRQRFHHVIIDTPPVLGFADARFISLLVDGVLLVTKCHSTNKGAGRMAYQLLSQAPILGAVLNSVGIYGQGYGNYYVYHHKYYSKYYDEKIA
jgi:succinoglycan biosynthesis transport protein ExoP